MSNKHLSILNQLSYGMYSSLDSINFFFFSLCTLRFFFNGSVT